MKPSAGRIVHYVPLAKVVLIPDECLAALVTAVYPDGEIALAAFSSQGLFFLPQGIKQDEDGKAGGTWHWPERVPE